MARASGANAASTARHTGRGPGTFLALVVVAVLILTSSAILASRPAEPVQAAVAGGTLAPSAGANAVGVPPFRDIADAPVATDPPPAHGLPLPQCPAPPAGAALARIVHHGARTTKVVALTFDDGYDGPNVLRILAVLQKAKVNATFFPIGIAIKSEAAAWKAVALAGYPIANHTYDHKHLKGLCWNLQLAELAHQDAVVRSELGIDVQPYMRPPYGDRDRGTQIAAGQDGEQAVVVWDIDTLDWEGLSARGITARALAGTNGSIILMHTMMPNTASALPTIIARYKKLGFSFVTVGQLLGIDGPVPFP